MIAAWKVAAAELGLRVACPFEISGTSFPVFLADFGSPKGALLLSIGDEHRGQIAKDAGFWHSMLNPEHYGAFDRRHFEDTLNDWGWYGRTAPPPWYTGKPWT